MADTREAAACAGEQRENLPFAPRHWAAALTACLSFVMKNDGADPTRVTATNRTAHINNSIKDTGSLWHPEHALHNRIRRVSPDTARPHPPAPPSC